MTMNKPITTKKSDPVHRPKIGIALGSGGSRGFAHIGVLKVLAKHHIPIDYVAGSSIGAMVGVLFALGHSPHEIQRFMSLFPQKYWMDYTIPKMGFVAGDKVKELIRMFTRDNVIENCKIPMAIVATNLQRGERVVFTQGKIAEAVRASISIPGIFVPEVIDGEYYVDGGVTDRVPVSVVKQMGADIAIGVDVSYFESSIAIHSVFDVIAQSIDIMEREILKTSMLDADYLLRPEVGLYSATMFSNVIEMIDEGERMTAEKITDIQQLIEQWKENRKK